MRVKQFILYFGILISSCLSAQSLEWKVDEEKTHFSHQGVNYDLHIAKNIISDTLQVEILIDTTLVSISDIAILPQYKSSSSIFWKDDSALFTLYPQKDSISGNLMSVVFQPKRECTKQQLIVSSNYTLGSSMQPLTIANIPKITIKKPPLFESPVIVYGILMAVLAMIFYFSSFPSLAKFFKIVPALLLCYLIPAILSSTGVISSESDSYKGLYQIATKILLPASLILLTLGIDLKALVNLGWKPIAMFLTGTVGVLIGGPIALAIMAELSPHTVAGEGVDAVWKGLATLAGSWIGGGANQTAMLEIFEYNKSKYGAMILVDIVVAQIWMAVLLLLIGQRDKINRFLKADNSSVWELQERVEKFSESIKKYPSLTEYMILAGVVFGGVALSYFLADIISEALSAFPIFADEKSMWSSFSSHFLWLILLVTAVGIIISRTKGRNLEGYGASKIGSVFIYILVAVIGMKMDINKIFENFNLIFLGMIWMSIHVLLLFIVAKIIRAPFFFIAVGSKANIGGAASAPVIASAFHPSLASVGALLAIFGYIIGSIAAILCAMLMQMVSNVLIF